MTTTWDVHPKMTKADMDKFLQSAFAVKENQYSVEELFDAAQDAQDPKIEARRSASASHGAATWHSLG